VSHRTFPFDESHPQGAKKGGRHKLRTSKERAKVRQSLAQQRKAIYSLRDHFLLSEEGESSWDEIDSYFRPVLEDYSVDLIEEHGFEDGGEEADFDGLESELSEFSNVSLQGYLDENGRDLEDSVDEFVIENWDEQLERFRSTEGVKPEVIKSILVKVIDRKWRDTFT